VITFDDADGDDGGDAPIPARLPLRALLDACAQEAAHLSRALAELDLTLGTALATGQSVQDTAGADRGSALLHRGLQSADRARQEGEGLARLTALLAAASPTGRAVPTPDLIACLPLMAQRRRIMALAAAWQPTAEER